MNTNQTRQITNDGFTLTITPEIEKYIEQAELNKENPLDIQLYGDRIGDPMAIARRWLKFMSGHHKTLYLQDFLDEHIHEIYNCPQPMQMWFLAMVTSSDTISDEIKKPYWEIFGLFEEARTEYMSLIELEIQEKWTDLCKEANVKGVWT